SCLGAVLTASTHFAWLPLVLLCMMLRPPSSPLFPYTTLFRSRAFTRRAMTCHPSSPAMWSRAYALDVVTQSPGLNVETSPGTARSEEHTSELQSRENLVCRLLLEKKNINSSNVKPSEADPSTT